MTINSFYKNFLLTTVMKKKKSILLMEEYWNTKKYVLSCSLPQHTIYKYNIKELIKNVHFTKIGIN